MPAFHISFSVFLVLIFSYVLLRKLIGLDLIHLELGQGWKSFFIEKKNLLVARESYTGSQNKRMNISYTVFKSE